MKKEITMATVTEDYVSFEVAELLKEKGFNEDCYTYYDDIDDCINRFDKGYHFNNTSYPWGVPYDINKAKKYVVAPTHQMAMKWLREIHNIDIDIEAAVGMLGVKVYIPYISTYKPLEGASSRVRQIKREIHYKDNRALIPALQHFDSYEKAVEAALKYVLENLI